MGPNVPTINQGRETQLAAVDARSGRGRAPAARYTDPDYLTLERERIFERSWLVAGHAYRVASPGQYFTFDELDRSVIVLRDDAGNLQAFHNTCRHRGTRIVEGAGRVSDLRCPYHDWTYALDGRLTCVRDETGFGVPIDKEKLGLLPVRVEEAMGFVWLCFDAEAPSLASALGEVALQVAPYELDQMRPIQEVTWTLPCNWKAVLDNATESYHIPVVHGASIQPLTNNRPDFVTLGDHYRLSLAIADYGWRRWVDARTSRGGPYSERQRAALQKYVLFPNFLMNLVPCHLTVFQVWPIDAGSCRFFYGFYRRAGARPIEWLRAHATWLASRYVLREDKRILERFQRGAGLEKVREHRFHVGEVAIDHFHRVLERWVGE